MYGIKHIFDTCFKIRHCHLTCNVTANDIGTPVVSKIRVYSLALELVLVLFFVNNSKSVVVNVLVNVEIWKWIIWKWMYSQTCT